MKNLSVQQFEKTNQSSGLKDCGNTFIKCSSCGKKLVNLWRIRPDELTEEYMVDYQANCPYCGDKSFKVKETMGVTISGIYKDLKDDKEVKLTEVEDIDYDDNLINIKVKKCT